MFSRRDREGYLLIDHSDSPGLSSEECAKAGIPVHAQGWFGRGKKTKLGVVKCWHCERQIVMNPGRTRERHICPKCDNYLCDVCHTNFKLTFECITWTKREDEFHRLAALSAIKAKL